MRPIHELSVRELADSIRSRELTATRVHDHFRERIDRLDSSLHCWLRVDDAARSAAESIDARLDAGEDPGPLAGVPIAVKDNICIEGRPATCGSLSLENYRSPFDATAIARLRDAGAVFLGQTNLDEFAMGSSTEASAYGATQNPWDRSRAPGGSSGGSAAAVAAGMVPAALGSDTGGSVRQPASFCGVTGLKPSYGRISRYGLVAFGSSLDVIGTLTRDAEDAALLLGIMAGEDPHDASSSDRLTEDWVSASRGKLAGLRFGVPAEYMSDVVDGDLRRGIETAIETLVAEGAERVEITLPHSRYAIPIYYIVATCEASSNLARFDGVGYGHRTADGEDLIDMYERTRSEGLGDEVKRRIVLGTWCLSSGYYDAYYDRALRARTLVRRDFERAFEDVDLILGPTTPTAAFKLGEKTEDPLSMYLADILTVSANLAGVPAISVPAGFVETQGARLPIGLQLIGRPFDEATVLRAAATFQRLTRHHEERALA